MEKVRFDKGDKAYRVVMTANGYAIREYNVFAVCDSDAYLCQLILLEDELDNDAHISAYKARYYGSIGDRFFKTREEAENALKEWLDYLKKCDKKWENRKSKEWIEENRKDLIEDFDEYWL